MKGNALVILKLAVTLLLLFSIALCAVLMVTADAEEKHPLFIPDGLPWGTVIAFDVNFRTGPGTEYPSLFQWGYGHAVEIIREVDGWYEVHCWVSDRTVWVKNDYIKVHEQKNGL